MDSLLWFKFVTESVLSKWLMSARTDFHITLFFRVGASLLHCLLGRVFHPDEHLQIILLGATVFTEGCFLGTLGLSVPWSPLKLQSSCVVHQRIPVQKFDPVLESG